MYPLNTLRGRRLDTTSRDFIVNIAYRVANSLTGHALWPSVIVSASLPGRPI